jgi:hypothetical protein
VGTDGSPGGVGGWGGDLAPRLANQPMRMPVGIIMAMKPAIFKILGLELISTCQLTPTEAFSRHSPVNQPFWQPFKRRKLAGVSRTFRPAAQLFIHLTFGLQRALLEPRVKVETATKPTLCILA